MTKDRRTTKYNIRHVAKRRARFGNTRREIGLIFFAGVLSILPAVAQASDVNINPDLLTKRWQASWVSHPTASPKDYGVYHFRRTFDLENRKEKRRGAAGGVGAEAGREENATCAEAERE